MVTLKIISSDGETRHDVEFILIALTLIEYLINRTRVLISFEKVYVKFSIDIFHIVCPVFAEFLFILVTHFRKQFEDTEKTEGAPCLFSLFYKGFVLIMSAYKIDPLPFCPYLHDQK